jgi:hypothetical protein
VRLSSSVSSNDNNINNENETMKSKITTTTKREMALLEAQELRNKARALREEAQRQEELLTAKKKKRMVELQEKIDSYIQSFLEVAEEVASQEEDGEEDPVLVLIRDNANILSTDTMLQIIDRLFQECDFFSDDRTTATKESSSTSTPLSSSRLSLSADRINELLDRILYAYEILDEEVEPTSNGPNYYRKREPIAPMLRTRIKELLQLQEEQFKRKINIEVNKFNDQQQSLTRHGSTIQNNNNNTLNQLLSEERAKQKLLKEYLYLPQWVPDTLDYYIVNCDDDLSKADSWQIKSEVLLNSLFCCTSSRTIRTAAIYRGYFLLPTSSSSPSPMKKEISMKRDERNIFQKNSTIPHSQMVFQDVQRRLLCSKGGLNDRVQLFFIYDPEWRRRRDGSSNSNRLDMDSTTPKPVIVAIPKSVTPVSTTNMRSKRWNSTLLTSLSWFLTVIFSFRYSISAYALNLKVFQPVLYEGDLSILARGIPMTLGVLPILQSIHELAHRTTATYYNVTLGVPRSILPLRPFGSYSAITPLRSFPASRVHLMDIASSGPISALLVSVICLVLGITFSCTTASNSVLESMPVVSVEIFRSSFLLGSITCLLSPRLMLLPLAQPVPVHPLVMVGYSGLFSSALNLLPIGKLDGGRMFMAAFGRGTAKLVTAVIMGLIWPAALLLLPTGFLPKHFSLWNFLAILSQSSLDVQLRDEVTEIDTFRRKCYIGLLVLIFTILIPFPRTLC